MPEKPAFALPGRLQRPGVDAEWGRSKFNFIKVNIYLHKDISIARQCTRGYPGSRILQFRTQKAEGKEMKKKNEKKEKEKESNGRRET